MVTVVSCNSPLVISSPVAETPNASQTAEITTIASVKTENKPIATSKYMEDVLLQLIKNNNDTLHEKANINGVMLK